MLVGEYEIRDYDFIPQSDSKSCGAACLAMVYKYYGSRIDEPAVYKAVVGRDPCGGNNCRTALMCTDALNRGFTAMAFSAIEFENTVRYCLEQNIELIFLYHPKKDSLAGHFNVIIDIVGGSVYVYDPLDNRATPLRRRFCQLVDLTRTSNFEKDNVQLDNTMIAIQKERYSQHLFVCPCCGASVIAIDSLLTYTNVIICNHCEGYIYPKSNR